MWGDLKLCVCQPKRSSRVWSQVLTPDVAEDNGFQGGVLSSWGPQLRCCAWATVAVAVRDSVAASLDCGNGEVLNLYAAM